MEKSKASATDIILELRRLKTNLQERMDSKLVPQGAKQLLRKFDGSQDIEATFMTEVTAFYRRCISYIQLWENSFGGAEIFAWVGLHHELKWDEVERSAETINEIHGSDDRQKNNIDDLFDELSLAKTFFGSKDEEWSSTTTQIEYVDKWVQLFKHFQEQHVDVPNLVKMIQYVLCLPGTSAPLRVFSIMKHIWSDDRGRMLESTVRALLHCKLNFGITCNDFYEKIKKMINC